MKSHLVDNVSLFLLKNQFTMKILTGSCFDVVARKQGLILFLKLVEDANSITKESIEEMKSASNSLDASVLIIAEKAGSLLSDNVVYSRFGVYCLNPKTLKGCLENDLPFVKRSRAGLVAQLYGSRLKMLREQEGFSLNSLAKKIGVSSRMVVKYEQGTSEVTINKALKIYDIFGGKVFNKIDIFSNDFELEYNKSSNPLEKKYLDLGFNVSEMHKLPFDIVAKKQEDVIITEVGDNVNPHFQSLSKIIDASNLVIFDRKKPKDIPALSKEEFMEFEKAEELIRFIRRY